jgi:hypothetical protein
MEKWANLLNHLKIVLMVDHILGPVFGVGMKQQILVNLFCIYFLIQSKLGCFIWVIFYVWQGFEVHSLMRGLDLGGLYLLF